MNETSGGPRREALGLPSWTLTLRQLCDFELLANGGFAPLTGFMRRADYDRVLADMHLANGTLWPIPVTLGVSREVADQAVASSRLALRDSEGTILGVLHVEDAWEPDIVAEAEAVYGTANREHAGVAALFEEPAERYLGGRAEAFALPEHFDFREHRHTPAQLRAEFARRGWRQVVAFQTRNPMHRAHYELTVRAASPLSPLPPGEGNASPLTPVGAASPLAPLPSGEGNASPLIPLPPGEGNASPLTPLPSGEGNASPLTPLPSGEGDASPLSHLPSGEGNASPLTPLPSGEGNASPLTPLPSGEGNASPLTPLPSGEGNASPLTPLPSGEGNASPLTPLPSGEGNASPLTPLPSGEGNGGLKLLIHPSVGATKAGDVDHYTRVRCYKALLPRYAPHSAMLSLLPLAMRMAGPREALWHAIIRKNYGCTHFIVGRDHAGPGADAAGKPFYGPYDAHDLVRRFKGELGIEVVSARDLVYVPEAGGYVPDDQVPKGAKTLSLSGTEFRRRLAVGEEIPEWLSFPEVIAELRPGQTQAGRRVDGWTGGSGCAVLLTGLPASGKSTIAKHLVAQLRESGVPGVTLIDGDLIRRTISSDLGFSREDREKHVGRVARMAAEVVQAGGVAVCAVIAPFETMRAEFRRVVEEQGRFVLVYVATPLAVCEGRDPKGLYAKARAGVIGVFTGVSDPYEVPGDAEVSVDTSGTDARTAAVEIASLVSGIR